MASLNTNVNNHARNLSAATKIFTEYWDFIRAVIRYKVGNETQADDLCQDFFLSLVSNPVPPRVQNIKSYLYRAITNDIVDAARRVERYQTQIHRYAERLKYSTIEYSSENTLIETEEMNKMFELIEKRLPRSEAQAVALRYRNNHDIEEVAEKMRVNKRSVSRYISIGIGKIRQFLTVNQGNYDDRSHL